MRNTFHKKERLCSTKIIADLFENGNIFYTTHLKVIWAKSPVEIPFPVQVAISVSKKTFKSAVTRNLIRRRIREAYRLNKNRLYDYLISENIQISLIVIFRCDKITDYFTIEKSVLAMIDQIMIRVKQNDKKC